MALRRKPHQITVIAVADSFTGGRVDVPTNGTARSIRGQITPLTAEQAVRTFGGDIDLKQPHLMLCDILDARNIKPGHRIIFDNKRFYVSAPVMNWNAGESTNHAQILLELEQFQ